MARATRASSPAARSLTHGPDGTTNPLHGAEPHKLLVEAAAARRQIQTRRAPNVRVRQHATVSEKPPRAHRQWTEARRRPGPHGGSARGVPAVSREPAHGSSLNPPRAPRRAGALDRTGAARRADEKRRRRRPRSQNRRARFGAPAPWTVRGLRSRSARGLKRARPRLKSDPPQGARGQRIPPIGTVVFSLFFPRSQRPAGNTMPVAPPSTDARHTPASTGRTRVVRADGKAATVTDNHTKKSRGGRYGRAVGTARRRYFVGVPRRPAAQCAAGRRRPPRPFEERRSLQAGAEPPMTRVRQSRWSGLQRRRPPSMRQHGSVWREGSSSAAEAMPGSRRS